MKLNRKIQIHMLPTEDESNIVKLNSGNILYNYREPVKAQKPHYTNQYLYITTDEKVKDGDWYYSTFPHNRGVNQRKGNWRTCFNERKIIATTDTKLGVTDLRVSPVHNFIDLPKPSKSFIEAFCKAGGIKKAMVEYNLIDGLNYSLHTPDIKELKVNSHNEITIHPIKDNWTREEVTELLGRYGSYVAGEVMASDFSCSESFSMTEEEWIEKNL